MASTQDILDAADTLGRLLAEHEAVTRLSDTLGQIERDSDAKGLMTDYERQSQAVSEKQSAGKPIEVEDKRKLKNLQEAVAQHPLLQQIQMVQMDYLDLMRKVDQRMTSHLEVPRADADTPGTGA